MKLEQTKAKHRESNRRRRAAALGLDPDRDQIPPPKPTGKGTRREMLPHGQTVVQTDKEKVTAKLKETGRRRGSRDLATIPGVQSLSIATRYLDGGREMFLTLVQAAALEGDQDAEKFLLVYQDLSPYEQKIANFDEITAAAGVRPSKLVAAMTTVAMERGRDVGNLVAAVTHPQVVAAGVHAAKQPDGIEDRKMLFQHHGFIPIPKATTINVTANAQAAAASQAGAASLPSFADDLAEIREGRQPAALPAAQPTEDLTFDADTAASPEPELVEADVDVD